jgi:predicted ATP-grasp superfamily ATP-dependent carboligase
MKRIAILEFIGCQDYLETDSNAIADLPADIGQKVNHQSENQELLREGDAMLLAVAKEWIQSHGAEVHCCRHSALELPSVSTAWLQVDSTQFDQIQWHFIRPGEHYLSEWLRVARMCGRALVIAPEIDNALLHATRFLRSHAVDLINASDEFIATASDKWLTALKWQEQSIRQPMTRLLCSSLFQKAEVVGDKGNTNTAWVVKPRDGAGGIGVRRFSRFSDLVSWARQFTGDFNRLLYQPWMPSRSASIALIFLEDGSINYSPARDQLLKESTSSVGDIQWIELGYLRSGEPWPNDHQKVAEAFARAAIAAIPGEPRGWIGLDFLCDGSPSDINSYIAIEINPRLTSSYCSGEFEVLLDQ